MHTESHKHTNALIRETSPYLLQHAHNPVDWNAWAPEVLDRAKAENKLLIISVGYSACHWCHVMEHESFEDSTVAAIMNEHFISIKVDREERPDIDDIYMTACNLITGRGGWPLNAVALPDGSPVWAGTYFPKDDWKNVLNQFVRLKNEDYSKLEDAAQKLVAGIKQSDAIIDVSSDEDFSKIDLKQLGETFIANTDFDFGGIRSTQKFPLPGSYEFLLKYAYKFPDSKALEAVETTLNGMMKGGIYDHVEGGFSRYTVDKYWKVPHFEKMLYDNSQLISLYSQAYKLTKNDAYKRVVQESIAFMMHNWKDESGGYYSSYDADSEGVEGKFYTWTREELSEIIPEAEMNEFAEYYNVSSHGNWEEKNILFVDKDAAPETQAFLEKATKWKALILEERKKRVYPGLDDKLICAWNAMMIVGYADAYSAFGDEKYRAEALSIWDFVETNLLDGEGLRLNRNYKDGKSTINAFLDDYAQVVASLIKLYEITFDEEYLVKAEKMMEYVVQHFKSKSSSMFNFTSDLDPPLVAQKSELTDGAVPGSNSVTARNLHTLGLLLYNKDYLELSKQMMRNMKNTIDESKQPNFYANWSSLYFDMVYDPYEVAILGPNYEKLQSEMLATYHPNAIFLGGAREGGLKLLEYKLQDGEDFIYVCVNKACKLPVQSSAEALELLD